MFTMAGIVGSIISRVVPVKRPVWWLVFTCVVFPVSSFGIVLDCDLNADSTYTCVEITGSPVSPKAGSKAVESQRAYIEQARKDCVREAPPQRPNRKGGAATRSEDLKQVEKKYQQCVAHKAAILRQADQ